MRRLLLFAAAALLTIGLAFQLIAKHQSPGSSAAPRAPVAARVPPQVDPTGEQPRKQPAKPRHRGRPNLVYVIADDMRWDDLRFAPNVQRLVQQGGVSFENSFANYPLCCPARATYFTGQYAHNHKVLTHEPPYGFASFDDSSTLAGSLERAGYQTGFVGKYLNGYGAQDSRVSGEPSYTYVPDGWTDWYGAVERPGPHQPVGDTYDFFRTNYNINGVPSGTRFHGEYQTDTLGRFSRDLVGKYAGRKPFFLYLSFVAPHHGGPVEADDPMPVQRDDGSWQDFSTTARPDWVKGRFDDIVRHAPGLTPGGEAEADVSDKPGYFRTRPELNGMERAGLLAATRQRAEAIYVMDRQIGQLVQRLKKSGEWRDTILIFTSDNGYFLGEHRIRQGKTTAQEPALRVPFLIAGPGIPRGEQRFDPITTVDITATLLDLAGAADDPPATPDGVSLVPVLRDGDHGWDRPVLNEALLAFMKPTEPGFDERGSIGIRTSRWSLIRYSNGAGELYDLRADPDQLTNLFRSRQYADVRAALTKVWWQVKDCKGPSCRAVLPPSLRATPEQAADDYRTWAAGVRSGNSHSPAR